MNLTLKSIKKLIVAVIGFTILIIGVIMIVLPGPAFIVIPLGLAILATEFVWAKKWLNKVKEEISEQKKKLKI
ncbi:MAG: PGPGW domain-containing protein [Ignavibacteriaceae bacterium]|nr:PGPGW domain-containing protein [Ignavibacteriaceae bacterium]